MSALNRMNGTRTPEVSPLAALLALLALLALAVAVAPLDPGGRTGFGPARALAQDQPAGSAAPTPAAPGDTTVAPVAPLSEAEIKAKEEELERVRRDLEEKRREASEIAGQEQDAAGEVEKINEELTVNQQLLTKLGQRKAELLEEMAAAQQDLNRAQVSLGAAGQILGSRLRSIYKFGRGQAMEVVLTAKTFADLAKRIYYLSVVADQDRELMDRFEETVETKQVLVEHIDGKRLRLEETETEVAEETRNLAERKEERDALVERLKSRRSYYESLARDLQEASRNLEDVLGRLEEGREEAGGAETGGTVARRMGRLSWPCEGEVISDFGVEQHPKFGTIIKNNGIDIKASAGTRVRAVAAGNVSFAGPMSGFGNCVILDHGGGYYTLYGRLEAVAVTAGVDIGEGEAIGLVGETSAPEGAVLHFEIREGKRALDPRLWLLR
ncbi:MAG: peptidoglycan DD-metalloendopeptidase family protein [bacterium]